MPINRVLKRIPGPVLGTRFGGFCEWYLRFGCPKHDLADAQDRPDFVCVSVCLLQDFFCSPFFDDFCEEFTRNFRKNALENGGLGRNTTPNVTRFRTGHLAEVVALSSSGDCGAPPSSGCLVGGATQLVTCICGATCPL